MKGFQVMLPCAFVFQNNLVHVLSHTSLHYRGMCCLWKCLLHRSLSCTWTCLQFRSFWCTWTCLHIWPELLKDVSALQRPFRTNVHYRDMSFTWMYLDDRILYCSWTSQEIVLLPNFSTHPGLSFARTCLVFTLHYRGFFFNRTCLHRGDFFVVNEETVVYLLRMMSIAFFLASSSIPRSS